MSVTCTEALSWASVSPNTARRGRVSQREGGKGKDMMIKKSEWVSVLSQSLPCAVDCYFIHSTQVFLHFFLPSLGGQSLQTEILLLLVNKISASHFLISSPLLFIQLNCFVFRIFVYLNFPPNQAQNNTCFISSKDINRSQNTRASPCSLLHSPVF